MNAEGRELLERLRGLSPRRAENLPDTIRERAQRVKDKLEDLLDVVDPRLLKESEGDVKILKKLKGETEDTLSSRRKFEGGAMLGNVVRIGGTLAYAHPLGQAAYWAGAATSVVCDLFAYQKGTDVDNIDREFNQRLQNWENGFRPIAGAIRRLDEAVQNGTGMSLYSEEFQAFLKTAAEERNDEVVPPCTVTNEDHKKNLVEIARNRKLLELLQSIMHAISRRDVVFLRLATNTLFGLSFMVNCPEHAAAFQIGELAVRGINMYLQYRKDEAMVQKMDNGIENILQMIEALKDHC